MRIKPVRPLPLVVAACMLLAGGAIWMTIAAPAGASAAFSPRLADTKVPAEKVVSAKSAPYTVTASPKRATKIAKPKPKSSARKTTSPRTSTRSASNKTRSTSKPKATKSSSSKSSKSGDLARAQSLLRSYIRKYPILKGSTVSMGDARGHQAICYYGSGRIVISPKHKASIDRIMAHEIWHIIDYRDNGKINWGESVPPKNASSFAG